MIRPCVDGDLPVIKDIANRAWQPIYQSYEDILGPSLFSAIVPDREAGKGRQIEGDIKGGNGHFLVCERGGAVVGFITLLHAPGQAVGEIGNNAVDRRSGEKGVGQEMYAAALVWFRERGCRAVKVSTGGDRGHELARKAYERAGFAITMPSVTYFREIP